MPFYFIQWEEKRHLHTALPSLVTPFSGFFCFPALIKVQRFFESRFEFMEERSKRSERLPSTSEPER